MVGPDIRLLALLVGLLCGLANVLVDVDHIPSYFGIGSRNQRRFLHRGFFLVSLGGLACAGGLLLLLILTGG
jgi:membrane-bound metal-dependent hydrolase YbcI (DUF457 family)